MAPSLSSINTNVGPNGTSAHARTLSRSANDRIERFPPSPASHRPEDGFPAPKYELFNENTRALVYGLQPKAVQGMLDFDFICRRKTPSVAGIIYPFGGQFILKQYWGTKETLLPVYQKVEEVGNSQLRDTNFRSRLLRSILMRMSLSTLRPAVVHTPPPWNS
jgi:ATP citrate (pro-S)-lyase